MADVDVPTVQWSEFMAKLRWYQGEHVVLIGPNGSGKTVINKHLLRYRQTKRGYVCVFVTKPTDDELSSLVKTDHYLRVRDNRDWTARSYPRLLLWPTAGNLVDHSIQKRVFYHALEGMWKRGRWTAMLNELRYLTDVLGLKKAVETLYLQARSAKFSLTAESQRPRHVPLEAFSQSTHDFFMACRDDDDLKRISGIGNADPKVVRRVVAMLKEFQTCYVHAKSGLILVTKATPFTAQTALSA